MPTEDEKVQFSLTLESSHTKIPKELNLINVGIMKILVSSLSCQQTFCMKFFSAEERIQLMSYIAVEKSSWTMPLGKRQGKDSLLQDRTHTGQRQDKDRISA